MVTGVACVCACVLGSFRCCRHVWLTVSLRETPCLHFFNFTDIYISDITALHGGRRMSEHRPQRFACRACWESSRDQSPVRGGKKGAIWRTETMRRRAICVGEARALSWRFSHPHGQSATPLSPKPNVNNMFELNKTCKAKANDCSLYLARTILYWAVT